MTPFLVAGSVLLAVVLALLLPPLLRGRAALPGTDSAEISLRVLREQLAELERMNAAGVIDRERLDGERAELQRRALEEGAVADAPAGGDRRRPVLAAALMLGLPLLAGGLYWQLGRPDIFAERPAQQANHALDPRQIEAMAMKLAERLQDNPQDGPGWAMLARSYAVLRRYGESAAAYGRATALLPADANLLADYADTLAMAQGRRLAGEPEKLVARALEADPNHIKALALRGSAAFERQDHARAIADWERVISLVPPESGIARSMRNSIADARARTGKPPDPAAGAGGAVSGIVSIDPGIQVGATDTLFIFARATDGSRMPLAMLRRAAGDLPLRFRLDDSLAMSQGNTLSRHRQVIVGARVSRSGDAQARPGDVEGYSPPVAVGSDKVRVVITAKVE